MTKRILIICSYLLLTVSLVFAQDAESIDDLFSVPDDTQNQDGADTDDLFSTPDKTQGGEATDGNDTDGQDSDTGTVTAADILSALNTDTTPLFTGTYTTSATGISGLPEWDSTDLVSNLYAQMYSYIDLDVRPKDYLRYHLSFLVKMNTSELYFPTPTVDEFFLDYTLKDQYFFRIGMQDMEWGQGVLVDNPGDLVEDAEDLVSVKAFIPLGINGLTLVVMADEPNLEGISYAGLFETTLGPLTMGFSGRLSEAELLAIDSYVKTQIAGVDVMFESRFDTTLSADSFSYTFVSGFLKEFADPNIYFTGEYIFENDIAGLLNGVEGTRHRLGFSLVGNSWRVAGWKPGIVWYQGWEDDGQVMSGQVIPGLSRSLAPGLGLKLGLPIAYGPDDSYYRLDNDDPVDRVLALVVQLTLSGKW